MLSQVVSYLAARMLVAPQLKAIVMLLLLHGEIFLFIPGVVSLAAAVLFFVALKRVVAIKRSGVLSVAVIIVALFFLFAGMFCVYASEFWYVVNASGSASSSLLIGKLMASVVSVDGAT